jgi:uncharacterized protein (TIGR02001 family)
MCEEGSDRDDAERSVAALLAMSLVLLSAAPPCEAADPWGGSIDLTSDYLVRGVSRSDDHPALQLELHYLDPAGFVAGVFASSTQIDPRARRDAELSAFLGYIWSDGKDWQGKILAANYSYPWNQAGSLYNYDEIDLQISYQQWMQLALSFYPDVRRYSYEAGVAHVTAESAELNLQRPLIGKLSATAGIGYYESNGAQSAGYAYWSAGIAYDWAPVSLGLSYVGATGAANSLFYNAAVGGRWSGTVFWRF